MVGLSLFDVGDVCTYHGEGLNKFDEIHAAYKSVPAVAKTTAKFDDTEKSEYKLEHQDYNRNSHQ